MRLIILAAITALATAIPLESPSHSTPAQAQTPSAGASPSQGNPPVNNAPSQTPEQQAELNKMLEEDEKESTDPLTCPMTQRYKACCKTIDAITEKILEPIGKLIPVLDGATIQSSMAFECKEMGHDDGPDQCPHDAMCCSTDPKAGKTSSCVPYDHAMKKKKEALKKNQEWHQG